MPFRPPELADAALTPQPVSLAGVPLGHASACSRGCGRLCRVAKSGGHYAETAVTESAAAPAAGGLRARFLGAKATDKATRCAHDALSFPQPDYANTAGRGAADRDGNVAPRAGGGSSASRAACR